ncbi:hypothetical protein DKX38_028563 [Salix brachista]|uniref:CUE domain-containing protein n=1 Tax=Salix brachista TaxID=2182728 RepID=A0A5N5JHL9_9ROSI|nr:hypothetical protein DKX38_028563 [Salix brachista]
MSAIVCGKRSFFEELTVTSPPVSKRIRCSSSSPVRFSPPRSNTPASNPPSFSSSSSSTLSEQLAAIFPDMDKQLIEKVLEECGDDLDSAIRSLNDLRLGSAENFRAAADKSGVIDESNAPAQELSLVEVYRMLNQFKLMWRVMSNCNSEIIEPAFIQLTSYTPFSCEFGVFFRLFAICGDSWGLGILVCFGIDNVLMERAIFVVGVATTDAEAPPTEGLSASAHLSLDGAEWVELFVREMMSASNIDDARARASRALEVLEKSICALAGAEAVKSFHQEHMILKEQVQALIQENTILKRAVSIQHERQKEYEERNQELQQLKQLVSQYQDQLRTLESNIHIAAFQFSDPFNAMPCQENVISVGVCTFCMDEEIPFFLVSDNLGCGLGSSLALST